MQTTQHWLYCFSLLPYPRFNAGTLPIAEGSPCFLVAVPQNRKAENPPAESGCAGENTSNGRKKST